MDIIVDTTEWLLLAFLPSVLMISAIGYSAEKTGSAFIRCIFWAAQAILTILVVGKIWFIFGGSDLHYLANPSFSDPIFLIAFTLTMAFGFLVFLRLFSIIIGDFLLAERE